MLDVVLLVFVSLHWLSWETPNKSRSNYPSASLYLHHQIFSSCIFLWRQRTRLNTTNVLTAAFLNADMEDLKAFVKDSGSAEANDLAHWDLNFWSERLRESKYDIDEVLSLQKYISIHFCCSLIGFSLVCFRNCFDYISLHFCCWNLSNIYILNKIALLETKYCYTAHHNDMCHWADLSVAIAGRTASLLCTAQGYGWPLQSCE